MQTQFRARIVSFMVLFASVLAFSSAPAQALEFFGTKSVAGSGHPASVKRELAPFHELAINLAGTVEVVQGNSENVIIDADDNLLPLVETVVKFGTLSIRPVKGVGFAHGTKFRILLTVRSVDSLSLAGSIDLTSARLQSPKLSSDIAGAGSITIQDLQCDKVSVSIAGTGRFEVRGAAKVMDVSIAGSGDVLTSHLSAQDVSVSISGSGNATVWARNSVSVSISGSGDVRYYGEGNLKGKSIVGSGRVRQLGPVPPA